MLHGLHLSCFECTTTLTVIQQHKRKVVLGLQYVLGKRSVVLFDKRGWEPVNKGCGMQIGNVGRSNIIFYYCNGFEEESMDFIHKMEGTVMCHCRHILDNVFLVQVIRKWKQILN